MTAVTRYWRAVLVGAVLIGLAVACAIAWHHLDGLRGERTRQLDAIQQAEHQAIALTTLDPAHVDAQLNAIQADTTGNFSRQFTGIADTFAQTVRRDDISSSGKVDAAGIETQGPTTASVLVAVTAAVHNSGAVHATMRYYRIKIDLTLAHGHWSISGMEFVS